MLQHNMIQHIERMNSAGNRSHAFAPNYARNRAKQAMAYIAASHCNSALSKDVGAQHNSSHFGILRTARIYRLLGHFGHNAKRQLPQRNWAIIRRIINRYLIAILCNSFRHNDNYCGSRHFALRSPAKTQATQYISMFALVAESLSAAMELTCGNATNNYISKL